MKMRKKYLEVSNCRIWKALANGHVIVLRFQSNKDTGLNAIKKPVYASEPIDTCEYVFRKGRDKTKAGVEIETDVLLWMPGQMDFDSRDRIQIGSEHFIIQHADQYEDSIKLFLLHVEDV